ncbi:hypothetical protein F5Y16DRAFT_358309 [Xylariaceae sp. FL0255]|nr:hypothetical protein F5Y16DRAFT_358309 [Xylariaceae sp. FL0255]
MSAHKYKAYSPDGDNNPDAYYHNNPPPAAELPASFPAELAGDEQSVAAHAPPNDRPNPNVVSPLGVGGDHHQSYVPAPLSGGGGVQQQAGANQQQGEYFPPPPPGPPPKQAEGGHQQYNYPPPPPGPPPPSGGQHHDYPPPPSGGAPPPSKEAEARQEQQQQQAPYFPPPPGYHSQEEDAGQGGTDEELPAYSDEFGHGAGYSADEKAPGLPPRPSQATTTAAPQFNFAPPPTSPYNPSAAGSSSSQPPKKSGGGGFTQKLYELSLKASGPINRFTNKLGSEAFWPTSLDKECDKAARILKSFCKDGFYTASNQQQRPPSPNNKLSPGPKGESKTLVKIPQSAIASAAGLAIFTTFRTGLHISGAGGSGVIVARLPDGSWSPPAGFLVHTLGAGFMIGVDIYDCVCILRTKDAVNAFARRARVSLGGELAVVAGPVGAGGGLEAGTGFGGRSNAAGGSRSPSPSQRQGQGQPGQQQYGPSSTTPGHSRNNSGAGGKGNRPSSSSDCNSKPVWSYMKSRGFYAGVQADGTIIIPRPDANAAFYGERGISVERILRGDVKSHPHPPAPTQTTAGGSGGKKKEEDVIVMWPEGGRQLAEVLKAAEGKSADPKVMRDLGSGPTPGDLDAHAAAAAAEDKAGRGRKNGEDDLAY